MGYPTSKEAIANYGTVDDIRVIGRRAPGGPWGTKSGGVLAVQFALPQEVVSQFADPKAEAAFDDVQAKSGVDIHGLRSYTVSDIPKGSVGGLEWHAARSEYVTAVGGAAVWTCVDFNGKERAFGLDGNQALIQPPGILHIYRALEDNTELLVVCNTLFVPDDPLTHDTFSRDAFYEARGQQLLEQQPTPSFLATGDNQLLL